MSGNNSYRPRFPATNSNRPSHILPSPDWTTFQPRYSPINCAESIGSNGYQGFTPRSSNSDRSQQNAACRFTTPSPHDVKKNSHSGYFGNSEFQSSPYKGYLQGNRANYSPTTAFRNQRQSTPRANPSLFYNDNNSNSNTLHPSNNSNMHHNTSFPSYHDNVNNKRHQFNNRVTSHSYHSTNSSPAAMGNQVNNSSNNANGGNNAVSMQNDDVKRKRVSDEYYANMTPSCSNYNSSSNFSSTSQQNNDLNSINRAVTDPWRVCPKAKVCPVGGLVEKSGQRHSFLTPRKAAAVDSSIFGNNSNNNNNDNSNNNNSVK